MFRLDTRRLGERFRTGWEANRWVSELFVFKMYHVVAAILIGGVVYHGTHTLGILPETKGQDIGKDAVLAGVAMWVCIALILHANRGHRLDRELSSNPLEWSKGSTAGCTVFILTSICLGMPLLNYPYPLTILTATVVEVIAATSGIAVYLWIHWGPLQEKKQRHIESLKAEHQLWSTIFSCSIIAVGVFIGGYLLSGVLSTTISTLGDKFLSVSEQALDRVIFFHGIAVAYAAAGTILWMFRPLHRRLGQISSAMDALAKDEP